MGIKFSGQQGGILRQEVTTGSAFTGVRTVHAAGVDSPVNERSFIYKYDRLAGDGEGLFEFDHFTTSSRGQRPVVFVSFVKLLVGAGVAWSLRITDGDRSGTATTIDDPALDVELASGTGNASVRLMRDFPPRCNLRAVVAAVGAPFGAIEVHVQPIEELARPWV